jgi:hypothetical protein
LVLSCVELTVLYFPSTKTYLYDKLNIHEKMASRESRDSMSKMKGMVVGADMAMTDARHDDRTNPVMVPTSHSITTFNTNFRPSEL